ncbi:MAG TPA: twin-arginine translocase TatA/TatE family subunit [Microbacterium sp.]|uniref:twin-arginine translocase TatA/TatE family subunit n=1 Tax=Microbacterium sp. TaxID=51671 RepID=UPI002C02D8AA|nr:twin-arginine translocase TatA/TatE family subunit [Microbacterium sp.]HWI31393.1 twin-arginine translocase TatA/TatE family subunit [Microbacterium sp.]
MANLTGWHGLILLAIVLLIFGASRLPALAKGVGQSVRIFQKEVKPKASERHAETTELAAAPDPISPVALSDAARPGPLVS